MSEEVQRLRRECTEIRTLNSEKNKEIGGLRQELSELRALGKEKDSEIEDLKHQLCVQVIFDAMYTICIDYIWTVTLVRREIERKLCSGLWYKVLPIVNNYDTVISQGQSQVIQRTSTWKLKWNEKSPVSARRAMWRGAATSVGAMAFFSPGQTGIVYIYDSTSKDWSELPHCLHLAWLCTGYY